MGQQGGNRYNVNIGCDVSGKIAVGSNITQIGGVSPGTGEAADVGLRPLPPAQRQEMARLRRLIGQHFNEDELRELALDLGLDYEDVAGAGKKAKVQELVLYFERRQLLDELVEVARERRPLVAW